MKTGRHAGYPYTRDNYVEWLNELEIPRDDLKSEGGRIPDDAKYGEWMRRNDPIAFRVGFSEWSRDAKANAEAEPSA